MQKSTSFGTYICWQSKNATESRLLDFLANESSYINDVMDINIEDNLSGFAGGRTSQQVIIKLAKFNAVLTYCLEFAYGEIIEGVNPMTARKHLFGKARVKGVSAKDFVKKEINCLYNLKEYVKLTKTGLWDKRNMDAYDALVCALYE